jgi:hypothetical protein
MPNKELACCGSKEVACVPNKEVACVGNKEVMLASPTNKKPALDIPISSRSIDITHLPKGVQEFIEKNAKICQPDRIYICDGSEEEYKELLQTLQDQKWIQKLEKMHNW